MENLAETANRRLAALEQRVGRLELTRAGRAEPPDQSEPVGERGSRDEGGTEAREPRDARIAPGGEARAEQDGDQPEAEPQATPASGADPSSSHARAERAAQLKERTARASETGRTRGARRRGGRTPEKGPAPTADEGASAPDSAPEKLEHLARKRQNRGREGGKKQRTATGPGQAPAERGPEAERSEEADREPGTT